MQNGRPLRVTSAVAFEDGSILVIAADSQTNESNDMDRERRYDQALRFRLPSLEISRSRNYTAHGTVRSGLSGKSRLFPLDGRDTGNFGWITVTLPAQRDFIVEDAMGTGDWPLLSSLIIVAG